MIKLLIADDSMLMRDILKDAISTTFSHIVIHEASTGKEAQQMLQKEHYDLILCDWEMPELSGLDLLKWVRSEPSLAKLRFFMVTGTTEKERVMACINEKVTDYIVKPFVPDVVCQKIADALKLK
jgi:CheY-like chemotaxis protein